ncbi:TPA: hypothetical protein ENG04_06925 [Candidatus Poribacteria bacterium]|nr:hypothetical protein [Candidatus Poribacteria bacterium]HEX29799.1 hypothetical protein [Candidatus Poribacteria bacterium]
MRAISAIGSITIKEGIRDKVFLNLLLFGLLMLGLSLLIGDLSMGQEEKFVKDLGLAAISIIGNLTAILLSVGSLHREFDRRTLYSVLYRPIPRWGFLIGKYVGVCATTLLNVMAMSLIFLILISIRGYPIGIGMLKAVYMICLEVGLIAAIGMLLLQVLPFAPSVIFTAALYVAGQMIDVLREMVASERGISRGIIWAVYHLLPNFGALNVRSQAAYGLPIDPIYLVRATAYVLLYIALLMTLSSFRFERGDLG